MKKVNQYETLQGRIVPGTTTICNVVAKPELYYWYGKHGSSKCSQLIKESTEFGSNVHRIIQSHLKGQSLDLEKDDQKILDNFLKEAEDVKEWLWFEKDFTSEKHLYGGTADGAYIDKNGKRVLMDIKTGNQVYPEYYVQMAAYEAGIKEAHGEEFDYKTIWHLDKETKDWEILKANTSGLFDVFLHMRALYEWKSGK